MTDYKKQALKLKRKLEDSMKEVHSINDKGRLAVQNEEHITAFKGMFRALEKYYSTFESLWNELVEHYEDSDKADEFPTDNDKKAQANVKRYYYEANTSYEEILKREVTFQRTRLMSTEHETLSESRVNKMLPKINLPNFDGHITNWPKFRDTFSSIVHNDTGLSKIEKFHYLISSLSGSASAVISHIPMLDSNYELAWKALNDTYDNKRMLASAYLNKLILFKPQQGKPTVQSLHNFLTQVSDNIAAFKLLSIKNEAEFILFHIAVRCLDPHTREQFEFLHQSVDFPCFDDLTKFLRERLLALQLANNNDVQVPVDHRHRPVASNFKPKPYKQFQTSLLTTPDKSDKQYTCIICKTEDHIMSNCKKFTAATVDERHKMLQGWKGCRNCLKSNHITRNCTSKWNCKTCKRRHHTMLHIASYSSITESALSPQNKTKSSESPDNPSQTSSTSLNSTILQESNVMLGTVIAEIQDARGKFQPVRLVVDSGSQQSFMSKQCLKKLGLVASHFSRKISAIGQTIFEGTKGKVTCVLKPRNKTSPLLNTEAVIVDKITSHLPNFNLKHELWTKYTNYDLADPTFWKPGPIDFLLGADLFSDIWTGNVIHVQQQEPRLFSSVFGHIVIGKTSSIDQQHEQSTFFTTVSETDDLNKQVYRFWEIEEVPQAKRINPEDKLCEEHFLKTHCREKDGKYVVSLPFKGYPPKLGDSNKIALKRLNNLEDKLKKDPAIESQYKDFMHEYLDLDHMSIASTCSKYVIPHHLVLKEDRNVTKLRVVFDASSKTSNGSLNDYLLTGTKLQKDIRDILLNFRSHPVVFVADIVKMYRNIWLHPNDRPYQHVLWRFDTNSQVDTYELHTLTYGLTSAPFLALRVISQLKQDEGPLFPRAAEVIDRDVYVDDIVTGSSTVEDAQELQQQIVGLLGKGGFTLSKWASNRPEILQTVHQNISSEPFSITSKEDTSLKILGLQWDPNDDCFFYKITDPAPTNTKRGVLSTIAKIYDPLGLLSPCIFTMKTFMQGLWKEKLSWDQILPRHLLQQWKETITCLNKLMDIRLPRFVCMEETFQYQQMLQKRVIVPHCTFE